MNEETIARIQGALEAAEKAAAGLPPGPRRGLALRSIASAREGAAASAPDFAKLLEAVRATTAPTLVQATEGEIAEELLAALAAAHDALLAPVAQHRLAAARVARDVDELDRVTVGAPTVVCVRRASFDVDPTGPSVDVDEEGDAFDDASEIVVDVGSFDDPPSHDGPRPDVPESPARPRPDWRAEEGRRPDPAGVRRDPDARTTTRSHLYVRVVEQALESIASLARDRDESPLSLRDEAEERILALTDAILCTPRDPIRAALDVWARDAEAPGAYITWAAAFALSRFEGADALAAVQAGLEALPADAEVHVGRAAEALALVPHPDRPVLTADLLEADHPVARAVGVDLAGRSGQLAPDALRNHILDPSRPVMLAALRSAARLDAEDGAPLRPLLERWIHFPDRAVSFAAARCLAGWGHTTPHDDLVAGGRLAGILGPLALELLVLLGTPRDKELFARIARRGPLTPQVLSAAGRYGHPEAWSILVHSLTDEDLAEHGARALETLFGPIVEEDAAYDVKAWKRAIAAAKHDPGTRLRLGRTWSPAILADELVADVLSRRELDGRLLELRVRTTCEVPAAPWGWGASTRTALTAVATEARRVGSGWSRDGWEPEPLTFAAAAGFGGRARPPSGSRPAQADPPPPSLTPPWAVKPAVGSPRATPDVAGSQLPSYLRKKEIEATREAASGTQPLPPVSMIGAMGAGKADLSSTTFSSGPAMARALPFAAKSERAALSQTRPPDATPSRPSTPFRDVTSDPPSAVIRSTPSLDDTRPVPAAQLPRDALPFTRKSEPVLAAAMPPPPLLEPPSAAPAPPVAPPFAAPHGPPAPQAAPPAPAAPPKRDPLGETTMSVAPVRVPALPFGPSPAGPPHRKPSPTGPPRLALDRYAALCAAIGRRPREAEAICQTFGLPSHEAFREIDAEWQARLGADPGLRALWAQMVDRFRASSSP